MIFCSAQNREWEATWGLRWLCLTIWRSESRLDENKQRPGECLSWVSFSARLFQVKMEREQHQTEIRDLQDQLSEMHDELDSAKQSEDREKGALIEVSWGQVTRETLSVWRVWDRLGHWELLSDVCLFYLWIWFPFVRASYAIVCLMKIFNHIEK